MLYQMDLSSIFGLCNALIILYSCLGNKSQPDHPSDFTLGSRQMFLINCFQSAGWVKSSQWNYGGGILELGSPKERKESVYMWDTYTLMRGDVSAHSYI